MTSTINLNKTKSWVKNSLLLSLLCINLAACAGANKSEFANRPFNVEAITSQRGAAVAVRVTENDSLCTSSFIKLRKIHNGVIDKSQFITMSSKLTNYIFGGYKDSMDKNLGFGSSLLYPWNLDIARNKMTNSDIQLAFRPIEPGDYILTEVRCSRGSNYSSMVGETRLSLFLNIEKPQEPKPLLGSNYIHISDGEFIDLGVLNITTIGDLYKSKQVMIIGTPASAKLQATMSLKFPDINAKIKYTTLKFDRDVMHDYITKSMPEMMSNLPKK